MMRAFLLGKKSSHGAYDHIRPSSSGAYSWSMRAWQVPFLPILMPELKKASGHSNPEVRDKALVALGVIQRGQQRNAPDSPGGNSPLLSPSRGPAAEATYPVDAARSTPVSWMIAPTPWKRGARRAGRTQLRSKLGPVRVDSVAVAIG